MKRVFILTTKVNSRKVETPLLKRNIHDNVRKIQTENLNEGNLNGENEGKVKVHHL